MVLLKGNRKINVFCNGQKIVGDVLVPGSKSLSNRAMLLAAVAEGRSELHNILWADDTAATLACLKQLAVPHLWQPDKAIVVIDGVLKNHQATGHLHLAAAGTLARFLPGLLASHFQGDFTLQCHPQLQKRPMRPLLDALRALQAQIHTATPEEVFPIKVRGSSLHGGSVTLKGDTSSQFLSGLLMAAPLAKQNVTIKLQGPLVQAGYVKMTCALMDRFQVQPEVLEDDPLQRRYRLKPAVYQACGTMVIEADVSTACAFWALAAIAAGRVKVLGITLASQQPDIGFLSILEAMGCHVITEADGITVQGPELLQGNQIFDLQPCSDQAMLVAVLAAFANGPVTIKGIGHIRYHECNRLETIASHLCSLGGRVDCFEDGLMIYPQKLHGGYLSSQGDHRLAMAMTVLSTQVADVWIEGSDCVAKTCPTFYKLLIEDLQLAVRQEL